MECFDRLLKYCESIDASFIVERRMRGKPLTRCFRVMVCTPDGRRITHPDLNVAITKAIQVHKIIREQSVDGQDVSAQLDNPAGVSTGVEMRPGYEERLKCL